MDNKQWFKQAKFGLMIHFGLYSLLAGEYKGRRTSYYSEWIMSSFEIPRDEYKKLAEVFNPIYFDADEWVKLAKDAGAEYLVVTSKHHEGFCLFKTEYNDFNVVDGTPFKRDIIKELAEACKRQGMKLGLYYSQDLDWSEPNGGFSREGTTNKGISWTNNWDFPDESKKDYEQCFRAKIIPQVKEILTKYGDLCLIWFDTPRGINEAQSKELYEIVKSIQPNCLVNTRIGNGYGDYHSMKDNEFPETYFEDLAETPATLNRTWGFNYFDTNWKDVDEVLRLKEHLNKRGINYLLNVGPDHLGRVPVAATEILKEVGKKIKEAED